MCVWSTLTLSVQCVFMYAFLESTVIGWFYSIVHVSWADAEHGWCAFFPFCSFFTAGRHLLPDSENIHQRNLTFTNWLPASVSKWFLLRGGEACCTQSSSFHIFFWTSVRGEGGGGVGAQILVVAHKPLPPALCAFFGSRNDILSLVGEGEWCQGRQDEAVTVSSQALIHEMKLLSDNGTALLLKQPVFSELQILLASTSSTAAPPSSLPPTNCRSAIAKSKPFLTSTQRNRICHQHFHTLIKTLKG